MPWVSAPVGGVAVVVPGDAITAAGTIDHATRVRLHWINTARWQFPANLPVDEVGEISDIPLISMRPPLSPMLLLLLSTKRNTREGEQKKDKRAITD